MPLNKLDNFLKNVEGRILYVSPSDLDASDAMSNPVSYTHLRAHET